MAPSVAALLPTLAFAQAPAARKPFRVVTTFTVIQDIAQNVTGTAAVVESITKPGAEIHDYQPTPLDIVRAQSAVFVAAFLFAPKRGVVTQMRRQRAMAMQDGVASPSTHWVFSAAIGGGYS